ncbi:hypothetical protein FE257_008022 [Aspergillus nanangensis]|uniref:Uncharacterized protein n=1 Tax=Aspergillus nanangensis TaxID=2582783 RepID=A0AAD4GTW4_ASPNN|nr:hypothetical protein FE257_008022 [Aspergillus nanangensis]
MANKDGRRLRSKGDGLTPISHAVRQILGVEDWPPPLLTAAGFYGCLYTNMLIGAHDPATLYSNYCVEVGFFYEHGYHKVFPEFEVIVKSEIRNPQARETRGGKERRDVATLGLESTRKKVNLEEKHVGQLAGRTAKVSRDELLRMMLYESGICGMAAEAIVRKFDRRSTVAEFIASSPGEDVADVGSDLQNSELFNVILSTADVADNNGIVTEDVLRKVYDGYSHFMARIYTAQWQHPGARMCAILMSWHIQDERHYFIRHAILGYSKVRRQSPSPDQREADIDEAFDEHMHTTGFSRPMENACNGYMICDQVQQLFDKSHGDPLLKDLWYYFAEGLVKYVSKGVIDEQQENDLAEGSRVSMARAVSYGLMEELSWLLCHANQHAWQVNRLVEASMFGSLLDDGGLVGKLDRRN